MNGENAAWFAALLAFCVAGGAFLHRVFFAGRYMGRLENEQKHLRERIEKLERSRRDGTA